MWKLAPCKCISPRPQVPGPPGLAQSLQPRGQSQSRTRGGMDSSTPSSSWWLAYLPPVATAVSSSVPSLQAHLLWLQPFPRPHHQTLDTLGDLSSTHPAWVWGREGAKMTEAPSPRPASHPRRTRWEGEGILRSLSRTGPVPGTALKPLAPGQEHHGGNRMEKWGTWGLDLSGPLGRSSHPASVLRTGATCTAARSSTCPTRHTAVRRLGPASWQGL